MTDWYDEPGDVDRLDNALPEPVHRSPGPEGSRTNARLDIVDDEDAAGPDAKSRGGADVKADKVVVWDFTALEGAARQAAQDALEDWVTTILHGCYDLVGEDQVKGTEYRRLRVPGCWAQHRDVLIELGWLAQTWHRAVRHDGGDLIATAEWHTRYLPAAIEWIRRSSSACACIYHHTELT